MESLSGKIIRLRTLYDEDFEYIAALRNDLRTQGWNQRLPPCFTGKKLRERFEERFGKEKAGIFGIELLDGRLIGYTDYRESPPRLGATVGMAIGVEFWGKGYALEAAEILLGFLFEERGLHVVRMWTQSGNLRAVNLAEKVGFKTGVILRESAIINGKLYDTLLMDILREEYYEARDLQDWIMDRERLQQD